MPILNIQYRDKNPDITPEATLTIHGPTIVVLVGPATPTRENGTIDFQGHQALALIDTGAGRSCIDEKLAQKLKLTPIDRQQIGGVRGKQEHLIYLGLIRVPPPLDMYSKGRFVGVDMGAAQPVLLGRDFLQSCVLIYNGTNGTISIAR